MNPFIPWQWYSYPQRFSEEDYLKLYWNARLKELILMGMQNRFEGKAITKSDDILYRILVRRLR